MRLSDLTPFVPPHARVLYVDDVPDVAEVAVMLLRLVGFDAIAAYSGEAALTLAETFRPHVCFLDLNMPLMEGDVLACKLQEQANGRSLVLAAVTAMDGPKTMDRLAQAGFHFHLLKPVDPSGMIAVLQGEG